MDVDVISKVPPAVQCITRRNQGEPSDFECGLIEADVVRASFSESTSAHQSYSMSYTQRLMHLLPLNLTRYVRHPGPPRSLASHSGCCRPSSSSRDAQAEVNDYACSKFLGQNAGVRPSSPVQFMFAPYAGSRPCYTSPFPWCSLDRAWSHVATQLFGPVDTMRRLPLARAPANILEINTCATTSPLRQRLSLPWTAYLCRWICL